MVINKVNINVYCNYNGTKRLNEKNPENTSYRKFWVYSGSDMGSFFTFWVYFDPILVFCPELFDSIIMMGVSRGSKTTTDFRCIFFKIHFYGVT